MIKYLWSAAGYALIAVPILFTRTKRSLGIQTGMGRREDKVNDAVAGRTESMFCFSLSFLVRSMRQRLVVGWVLAALVGRVLEGFLGDFVVSVLASVFHRVLTDVFKQQHTYPTDVCSSH